MREGAGSFDGGDAHRDVNCIGIENGLTCRNAEFRILKCGEADPADP